MRSKSGYVLPLLAVLVVSWTAASSADNGPVVARAAGGYHWTISEDDIFGIEVGNRLALNARKYADGSVQGMFEYKQDAFGETFRFHVSVTCFEVYDGNRAKIGGVIEISNDPTLPPGVFGWFQTQDNSEGGGGAPDWSTLVGFGTEQENEDFCNSPDTPRFGPWDVTGNVEVSED